MRANRTALMIVLTVSLGTLVCKPRQSNDRSAEPDANTAETSASTQAPGLAGNWTLQSIPPDTVPGRMQLEIRIDSVSGTQVHGRLVTYFLGDVGADPDVFPHFDGEITENSEVSLLIRSAAHPRAGFRLSGVLQTDTIQLSVFVAGPDTLSGKNRPWRLVRTTSSGTGG